MSLYRSVWRNVSCVSNPLRGGYLSASGRNCRERMVRRREKGLEWVEGHWRRPKGSVALPTGRRLTAAESSRRRQLLHRCKALREAAQNPTRLVEKAAKPEERDKAEADAGGGAEPHAPPSRSTKAPPLPQHASPDDAFIVFSDTDSDSENPQPERPACHLRSDPLRDVSLCEHCGCDSAHTLHISDSASASQPSRIQTALTSFGITRI